MAAVREGIETALLVFDTFAYGSTMTPALGLSLGILIAELIRLSKEIVKESKRGEQFTPPLGNDELTFFDAVFTGWKPLSRRSGGARISMRHLIPPRQR